MCFICSLAESINLQSSIAQNTRKVRIPLDIVLCNSYIVNGNMADYKRCSDLKQTSLPDGCQWVLRNCPIMKMFHSRDEGWRFKTEKEKATKHDRRGHVLHT